MLLALKVHLPGLSRTKCPLSWGLAGKRVKRLRVGRAAHWKQASEGVSSQLNRFSGSTELKATVRKSGVMVHSLRRMAVL